MATATVIESYVKDFLNLIDDQISESNFCCTFNRSFTRTRYYKHTKSNNQLLKAGEKK